MSCPMGYSASDEAPPLPPDVTGDHHKLMAAFVSLLPDCSELSSTLDECRERVAKQPSGSGHCLDESRQWMGCFNRRTKFSRVIVEQCGGEDYTSHGELQADYAQCMRDSGASSTSVSTQQKCLAPLRTFLQCASTATKTLSSE